MPNVEFFGLKKELAYAKICRIVRQLKRHPALTDMVFTVHKEVDVVDKDLKPQPFIRLTSTPREDLTDIKKTLGILELDIEVMLLDEFIPAKSE